MADGRDDPRLFLVDPDERGILPLDAFHIPSSLARTVRRAPFEVRMDSAFRETVEACAQARENRPETWINDAIITLYDALHRRGQAHSVECWQNGKLVGGLYGVTLGAAFFGESMFSTATDASKIALVHLVAVLRAGGFTLLDTQFTTAHLERFGVTSVPRLDYQRMLSDALRRKAGFPASHDEPADAARITGWLRSSREQAPDPASQTGPQAMSPGRLLGVECLLACAPTARRLHLPRT